LSSATASPLAGVKASDIAQHNPLVAPARFFRSGPTKAHAVFLALLQTYAEARRLQQSLDGIIKRLFTCAELEKVLEPIENDLFGLMQAPEDS
jgi:hypothetical protein